MDIVSCRHVLSERVSAWVLWHCLDVFEFPSQFSPTTVILFLSFHLCNSFLLATSPSGVIAKPVSFAETLPQMPHYPITIPFCLLLRKSHSVFNPTPLMEYHPGGQHCGCRHLRCRRVQHRIVTSHPPFSNLHTSPDKQAVSMPILASYGLGSQGDEEPLATPSLCAITCWISGLIYANNGTLSVSCGIGGLCGYLVACFKNFVSCAYVVIAGVDGTAAC